MKIKNWENIKKVGKQLPSSSPKIEKLKNGINQEK
jgi:hypothetical protein